MKRIICLACLTLTFCHKADVVIHNNIGTPITVAVVSQSLAKGVNLSNWFNDYSDPSQYNTHFSLTDLQRIKAEGFTYVRIPIGSPVLFQESNPGQLNPVYLPAVDAAVQNAINSGLAVVLDAFHNSNDDLETKFATVSGYAGKLASYWKSVATYFSKYPTDKIFFEVFNEPHVASNGTLTLSKSWWWPVQEKCIQGIRQATINHYIIAGAESWNSRYELVSNTPYQESNIIYNFHFYDPFLFTHQGATWTGWSPGMEARAVPYPSSPAAVDSLVNAAGTQADLKQQLIWYGSQKYNIDSLASWVKPVADWGKKYNVYVTCNEFGSYKLYCPRQSHLNWVHDMRTVLEQNNIGWAMWEYDEGFGLITYTNNDRSQPKVDNEILIALGLN